MPLFYPDVYVEIDDAGLARGISALFQGDTVGETTLSPVKHGFVDDCHDWPYSSYRAVLSTKPTRVQRATVLDWFGGRPGFEEAHALEVEERVIEALIVEDRM